MKLSPFWILFHPSAVILHPSLPWLRSNDLLGISPARHELLPVLHNVANAIGPPIIAANEALVIVLLG